jgi:hypothetical protein
MASLPRALRSLKPHEVEDVLCISKTALERRRVNYNQPRDVMGAIQTMRDRAYAAGTLKTTPQLTVLYQSSSIVIQPVNPAVVYVPVYNPWIVSGAPVPVYPAYYVAPAHEMCNSEHSRFHRHARCSGFRGKCANSGKPAVRCGQAIC